VHDRLVVSFLVERSQDWARRRQLTISLVVYDLQTRLFDVHGSKRED